MSASINLRNETAGGLKYLEPFLWILSSPLRVVQLITLLLHNQQTVARGTPPRPELQRPQETGPGQTQQEAFSLYSGPRVQAGGGENI